MMTRLTEEMVIARSKQSDLSQIKKLNCWGSDLSDVSILRKMRGVEVLALSVNQISTLQDFVWCTKLQELYLRRNKIEDINEIAHLQCLPALKNLWLEENPCVDKYKDNYRHIIIRLLPNLQKLDNLDITPQEREKAFCDNGYEAVRDDDTVYGYDNYEQEQQQQQQQQQQSARNSYAASGQQAEQYEQQQRRSFSSPKEEQTQPPSPKYAYEQAMKESRIQSQYDRSPGSDQESPQMREPQPPQQQQQQMQQQQMQQQQQQSQQRAQPIPSSMSAHSMKEYYQSERPSYPAQYRHSQTDLTEWDEHQHQYGSTAQLSQTSRTHLNERLGSRVSSVRENGDWNDDPERPPRPRRLDPRYDSAYNHHFATCHRRPINRNSNILSATLCLLKELDYNSLEVVEHAVRCRFDELSIE